MTAQDLDFILFATSTPETPVPSSAIWLQHKLGAFQAPAMDINAACAGFVFAMATADQLIKASFARKVLVVGTDLLSSIANWTDRNTCILFGDGSGAVILTRTEDQKDGHIIHSKLGSDGRLTALFEVAAGGSREPVTAETLLNYRHKATMKGKEMFREAVTHMSLSAHQVCEEAGIALSSVNWVLAHQANLRILEAVAKRLELPAERFLQNIERYGNTSAATIPTLLDENVRLGKIKRGDTMLLIGLGAGLTYGANLIKF